VASVPATVGALPTYRLGIPDVSMKIDGVFPDAFVEFDGVMTQTQARRMAKRMFERHPVNSVERFMIGDIDWTDDAQSALSDSHLERAADL
jgi:hypothetical protein